MDEFRTEFKQVNSKMITIDEDYQRMVDFNRVKRMVANYNPNLVNPIKVSFRNNKYYCFDGQHTLSMLKTKNSNQDLPVLCKVYYGMKKEDEARLFSEQNGLARIVQAKQKLKSLYIAGDVDVIEFKDTVEACGIKCDFNGANGYKKLNCYSTAFKIYQKYGTGHLTNILNIILGAWDGDADSFVKEIVIGLDIFIRTYVNEYDQRKLITRLSKTSPIRIKNDANAISTGGNKRYASVIYEVYNRNTSAGRLDYKF